MFWGTMKCKCNMLPDCFLATIERSRPTEKEFESVEEAKKYHLDIV